MKRYALSGAVILIVLVFVLSAMTYLKKQLDPIGNAVSKSDLIRVFSPLERQVIATPLKVIGEARGFWFFEASFPIKLVDPSGAEIAFGIATAKGEWMTEEFVPFEAVLTFKAPAGGVGKLILMKDNPSGLPEHDDALIIPIRFSGE